MTKNARYYYNVSLQNKVFFFFNKLVPQENKMVFILTNFVCDIKVITCLFISQIGNIKYLVKIN